MLLTERREDEVRVWDRQKVPLGLRPLLRALAPNPARPDRDQRLANLISRSPRVIIRVDKARQPGLLVRLQNLSAGPNPYHCDQPNRPQNTRLLPITPS